MENSEPLINPETLDESKNLVPKNLVPKNLVPLNLWELKADETGALRFVAPFLARLIVLHIFVLQYVEVSGVLTFVLIFFQ
ncbi:hypothetical protein MSSIT_1275 [Methanosarcina siciliae T4/M]|uniref:Uncharacterized protein n=1 Tax=Methanosarcina siciliae T4/M TaxID=1434120 RepID=A0A0E3P392_9EURY|nr:hypothetical protein [Methanosarcina siciliae]AKB27994.1 hypothetical protein MSSIT_1275 [Methanosarcina siciliae T4/M]